MRTAIAILSVLATTIFAAPSADAADELRKFGFGTSLNPIAAIEIPINLTPTFRVAPSVSLLNSSSTTKPDSGDESTSSSRAIGIGVGAYSLMRTEGPYLMYVGGRVGVSMVSQASGDPEVTVSGMDIGIAGVLGSEYFFNPRFSLGAEVALDILLGGDREASKGDDKSEETSMTIKTGSSVNARFYF